ncbi:hypothetical protein [Wolbachia endosymbiont of Dirofilaria (Dirofilaria) immitis]|uniref:hypothetical protein n=1 Tax=Wolbachia endosymbiont of Dirofilaria (Dirofilaria) immitis TaxID=1812115 RepID=UPI00158C2D32|nr:hypothetical protein [Wolbachia endosymbiont of Dirofilaria (Dirofilaria) immitis]
MDIAVKVGNLSNDDDGSLGKKESVLTSKEQDDLRKRDEVVDFSIPLSIFYYKGYNSDFFTSWYNVSSKIFKEISSVCPEKRVLNLALSVLMLPYVAFVVLGLVICSRFKADDKIQIGFEENKVKKGEVSESVPKRLAYGVLTAIVILVNVAMLVVLIIPATLALATFCLLNRKLSNSLIAALRISIGLCYNKHQDIRVSFHETSYGAEVLNPNIMWNMKIKFPPQFEQLLKDLCEDGNGKLSIMRDVGHSTILKLSANVRLKNGLVHLYSEISNVIAKSIREFARGIEKLVKLRKNDIVYDSLKKLLNEFRLKVIDSVDSKLASHLIQDAYRVAFIQAIKVAQREREKRGGLDIEERLKEVLVEQELKSQGKELPTEKEMIIRDLKISTNLKSGTLPLFRAKWKQRVVGGVIGVYSEIYPQETKKATSEARNLIVELKEKGGRKYQNIKEKLEVIYLKIHKALKKDSSSVSNNLRRKLEDIFEFEPANQYVYRELVKSKIRKAEVMLSQSDLAVDVKQGLLGEFCDLNINVCSYHEVNLLLEKMYLEIMKCKTQSLFQEQGKSIRDIEDNTGVFMLFDGEDEECLVNRIVSYREEVGKYLMQPVELKKVIEKQNKNLDSEKNSKEKESLSIELIELCLKNNQEILETLERLGSEKEGLLINEKTENDYREELTSREKIRFAVIEDDLLKLCKQETFNEKEIKKLLERAELECCLAEKCIEYPMIKTKDNIKHFCQALLSPLIGILMENIISNVPKNISKDNENNLLGQGWGWVYRKVIKPAQVALNYNKLGLSAIGDKNSIEGKALDSAHNTYKEVEMLLQYFESSYEKVGTLVGNVFSDDGETFKKNIWPQVKEHLCSMWNRFFKDIEFTLVNESENIPQETEETVKTKLSELYNIGIRRQALPGSIIHYLAK